VQAPVGGGQATALRGRLIGPGFTEKLVEPVVGLARLVEDTGFQVLFQRVDAGIQFFPAGLVVLGLLLSSVAVVRWLMTLLDQPETAPGSLPESGWERFYLLAGIALCTLLGLLPQLLYPGVIQVVRGLSNLTVGA
jgi:hypothetical protein